MASCQTSQWVSTAPYVKLTVTQSASTETTSTLSWTLQYIASHAADTNTVRSYTVKIGGTTVKSGTYGIDGKTGTLTIASGTHTITKGTSAQNVPFSVSFGFNLTWSGVYRGTLSSSGSISIPAKTSYTIKYNANGGTGAPSSQTKWHGTALALSSTKPTRSGYVFQGWATSSSGSVAYVSGASYTANASVTLYAVWSAGSYTVTYNSNGGTGAPSSQTKKHGTALTLSSTKPTMTNHTFKGWGTSTSSTTVVYAAGASYTKNASITLYAIWELSYVKPSVTNIVVERCNSSGTISDSGTYGIVKFDWSTYKTVSSIKVQWTPTDGSASSITLTASGTSGSVSKVFGSGNISSDSTYTVVITITDAGGSSVIERVLPGLKLPIDFLNGSKGLGVGIGKPAEKANLLDVALDTQIAGTHIQLGNHYTHFTPGVAGTAGYIRIVRIEITAANADTPITFVFSQRRQPTPMTVHIALLNSAMTASSLSSFVYEGTNYNAFLVQTEAMVWDLYVQKVSTYDTITLQDWWMSRTMEDRVLVTFHEDLVDAIPTPYHRATPAKLESLLDHIYPINSIYISYSHTDPGDLFGGTWTRITNAFLWATTSGGTIGQTGGESEVKLTTAEMPSHSHGSVYSGNASGTKNLPWLSTSVLGTGDKLAYSAVATGSSEAHNNMPPYIQVSVWRRTA